MATIIQDREPAKSRILKKVTPYSVGSRSFDQGDACFSITAFDDYVYFSLTEERNGEEVPLDLTGYGDIYLRFKNKDVDISIKSVEEIDSIDPSLGEAVFKIGGEDSLNVIATDLNSFAIVSRLDVGENKSFENVIFQGRFLKPDESTESTSRFDQLYNEEADVKIETLSSEVLVLRQNVNELETQNTIIQNDIDSLSVKWDALDKKYQKVLKDLGEAEAADAISNKPSETISSAEIDEVQRRIASLQRPLPTPAPPTNQEPSGPPPISRGGKAPVAGGAGVGFNQGEQGAAGQELIAPK